MTSVWEAITLHHKNDLDPQDLFLRHQLFIPFKGWIVVYDNGQHPWCAYVISGDHNKVDWARKI